MRAALQKSEHLGTNLQGPVDAGERQRKGLPADLEQQRAHDREGERQLELEAGAAAWLGSDTDLAPDLLEELAYDIQAHSPSGNLGDGLGEGESGEKEELEELRLTERLQSAGGGKTALGDAALEPLSINAGAIIADLDEEVSGALPGIHMNEALRVFAVASARFSGLDAVVDRIAKEVAERCVESLEDVAVDLSPVAC